MLPLGNNHIKKIQVFSEQYYWLSTIVKQNLHASN